jgi:hypothetical protein
MMRRRTRLGLALAGAVALVVGGAAFIPPATTAGVVTYRTTWDTTGVATGADGSWTTTTDLGYTVTVTSATLATYSTTLVSCPHSHRILEAAAGLLGPGVAAAGHSTSEDPAWLGIGTVDAIVAGDALVRGTVTVHEPAYCEGHIAWGAAEDSTLVVSGWFVAPGATEPAAFEIATDLAWGLKADLLSASQSVHVEVGDPIEITIVTELADLLDGIDFAALDDDSGRHVLRNLAAATRFEVTAGTAH